MGRLTLSFATMIQEMLALMEALVDALPLVAFESNVNSQRWQLTPGRSMEASEKEPQVSITLLSSPWRQVTRFPLALTIDLSRLLESFGHSSFECPVWHGLPRPSRWLKNSQGATQWVLRLFALGLGTFGRK